tara:strand:- start:918 stop:1718 length:801 start_codon:yes stop_codon:yes gene_type:complete
MKIVGFCQLHNELANGNLENWFKCMEVCDYIYIYDQNSTDGSKEFYKKYDNVVVIESPINNYENERICKSILLKKLLKEHPDTDWIYWIDGDTLMDGRLLGNNGYYLKDLCKNASAQNIDGIYFGHLNLWRSDIWYRVDNNYHMFDRDGRRALWRNNGNLYFHEQPGLHGRNPDMSDAQEPMGMVKNVRVPFSLIHRGFADDEQLIRKYDNYKSRGQSGNDLDRLLAEDGLTVNAVPPGVLPPWYDISNNTNPVNKPRIIDEYKKR